jgi:hypothetical protein
VTALDRTTREVKAELKRAKAEGEVIDLTYGFLYSCDLVKFAKYIPSKEEIEKDWNEAFTIVNMTKQEEVQPAPVST